MMENISSDLCRTRCGTPYRTIASTSFRDDGARSSLWWGTKNEWLGLIDVAGLDVEALYGGFHREPLNEPSREYVFVTRRRR